MAYTVKVDNFEIKAMPSVDNTNKFVNPRVATSAASDLNPIPDTITTVPASAIGITVEKDTEALIYYGCRFQMNITMNVVLRVNFNGSDLFPDIFEAKNNSGGIEHSTAARVQKVTLLAGINNILFLRSSASNAGASVCAAPFMFVMPVEDI